MVTSQHSHQKSKSSITSGYEKVVGLFKKATAIAAVHASSVFSSSEAEPLAEVKPIEVVQDPPRRKK